MISNLHCIFVNLGLIQNCKQYNQVQTRMDKQKQKDHYITVPRTKWSTMNAGGLQNCDSFMDKIEKLVATFSNKVGQ